MGFRSTAGKRFDGAPLKPEKSRASGRHCRTGLKTAARYGRSTTVDDVVVLLTNPMN
jgi:hypothetical protein